MFSYLFKNLPAQYVFAGYTVRKGLSTMTTTIDGNVVYDAFLNTYIDNYLSFYILMEDGKYKNVSEDVKVDSINAEQLISTHLERSSYIDTSKYESYDKTKPFAVFGLHTIDELLKIEEEDANNNDKDISMSVLIGQKKSYTGMEISGIIKRFNQTHGCDQRSLPVPAVKKDVNDVYESIFGLEDDFINFVQNKSSDEIVKEIRNIVDERDSLGNKIYETLD